MNQEQYRELQYRYNALVDMYQELHKYCEEHIKEQRAGKEDLNAGSGNTFDLLIEICRRIKEENLILESVSGDKKSAKTSQYIYNLSESLNQ